MSTLSNASLSHSEHIATLRRLWRESEFDLRDDMDAMRVAIDGLEEQLEALRAAALAACEATSYVTDDGRVVTADVALEERVSDLRGVLSYPARRPNPGEAMDAGGCCGRHGLFTGRMCPTCAEIAASAPAKKREV